MKKFILALTLILIISSCKVALLEVESNNTHIHEGKYSFKNDTIKVEYDFWFNEGVMGFSITNKLNTPIYIDWKKCSFLLGDKKFDYWRDVELRKSVGFYSTYIINTPSYFGSTTITKPERITFLPPGSKANFAVFIIMPKDHFISKFDLEPNESPLEFGANDSPIKFSNYITYSNKENFENEYYLKNDFHVSQIKVMKKSKVFPVREYQNEYDSPYMSSMKFFIEL
jgi:hypothetical protein